MALKAFRIISLAVGRCFVQSKPIDLASNSHLVIRRY
jgi:hypothetical protein